MRAIAGVITEVCTVLPGRKTLSLKLVQGSGTAGVNFRGTDTRLIAALGAKSKLRCKIGLSVGLQGSLCNQLVGTSSLVKHSNALQHVLRGR